MEDMNINITPESLAKSAVKYRKELLKMPLFALGKLLPYVTLRTGVRYKEIVGELSGNMQMAPYKVRRHDDSDVDIKGRELEVYFGNCVKGFNPNSVVQSLYGADIVKGEGLKNVPITLQVLTYLMGKMGENLYNESFTAVRDATGDTTHDLFNGLQTIALAEITAGNLATNKGNLVADITEPTQNNIIEFFEGFVDTASEKLKGQKSFLLCSPKWKRMYERAYREEFGVLHYNGQFQKTDLDGEPNVEIVGLSCVPENFLQLSTKENVLFGTNLDSDRSSVLVEKALDSHFLLDFIAAMFWGCQYESLSPERLLIGTIIPQTVATPTFSPTEWAEGSTLIVELATATAGATIYYTDDGSVPTTSSTEYNPSNKITLSASKTIKAIAVKSGMTNSQVATQAYVKP